MASYMVGQNTGHMWILIVENRLNVEWLEFEATIQNPDKKVRISNCFGQNGRLFDQNICNPTSKKIGIGMDSEFRIQFATAFVLTS